MHILFNELQSSIVISVKHCYIFFLTILLLQSMFGRQRGGASLLSPVCVSLCQQTHVVCLELQIEKGVDGVCKKSNLRTFNI